MHHLASFFIYKLSEHLLAKTKWITAQRCPSMIIWQQPCPSVWCEYVTLFIDNLKRVFTKSGKCFTKLGTRSFNISLCIRISDMTQWMDSFKLVIRISNLNSTLIDNFRSLNRYSSSWFVLKWCINKRFNCSIILIIFRNSLFLRDWIFKRTDWIELANSIFIQSINTPKCFFSYGFLMIC